MNKEIQRMDELYKILARHAHLYYDLDAPEISDFEYDALVRELKELELKHPELVNENSPTKRVGGAAASSFAKVQHKTPMLSLDNVFNLSELENFYSRLNLEKLEFTCEMKIDGAAVSLIYEDGKFIRGATRGDGKIGEDITENLRAIKSLPKAIKAKGLVEVRGEVLMKWDSFNNLNKSRELKGESLFANPRNAASGTLRQLDAKIVEQRGLDIFLYYLVDAESHGVKTQSEVLNWLIENNLPVQPVWKKCVGLEQVNNFILEWQDKRFELDYVTDGAVIKLDDLTLWNKIGATSHAPRWAVAYKYPPEVASAKLLSIDVSVGRTGVLTPVANLEPVRLAGTQVSRAGLHNFDEIKRKDIRVGDIVKVRKAAEIIPEIIEVDKSLRNGSEKIFEEPVTCPACGERVVKVHGEVALRCVNRASCPAQLKESIVYFASRSGLNIMGLGDKLAEQLVNSQRVKILSDLYDLSLDEWASFDKMGVKSASKILAELEKSKTQPAANLIAALGIRYVGKTAAEILCNNFNNFEDLKNASAEKLAEIEGIGEVTAESVRAFFDDKANLELLNKLEAHGLNFKLNNNLQAENNKLAGKIFVFTGELSSLKRDDAANLVKALGGKVTNSVSSKTNYLVAGDKGGSKLSKAESLGVKIIDEQEFLNLIKA
ncbi:MAG: NAD-dependent DNA ligase LigA [Synergistaceae bacterium]|nr:NAD-dependent DNA ligase LigA [Synergistaceae bacterium]